MFSHVNRTILLCAVLFHLLSNRPEILAAEPGVRTYQLDAIITLALERNPAMAGAEAVLEQRRGERIQAGAYPNPTIIGQTGRAALRDPSTGDSRTEYILTLHQPLEWIGKRAVRQRAAEAGLAGARAGIEEVRLNVIAQAKIAFYGLLLAQREAELVKQNLGIVKEVARVAEIRVKAGEAARLESLKAEVEVLKTNQEVARARKAVRVGRVRLNTVTGGALGRAFAIEGGFRSIRRGLDLEALTARAVEQHPTIRRLQRQVERAGLTVVKERQSRFPDVTIYGGYAREIGREAVVGGLSVPTPLWYQRQGDIAAALGAQRGEEAALFHAQNDLLRSVSQHFADAETAAEQIAVYEQGLLKLARETLRIARFSFRQGASSLLEVLDAQRVSRQIELEYARARQDLSIALTRLERAVGGTL